MSSKNTKRRAKKYHNKTVKTIDTFNGFPKLTPPRDRFSITAKERETMRKWWDNIENYVRQYIRINDAFNRDGAMSTGVFPDVKLTNIDGETQEEIDRQAYRYKLDLEKKDEIEAGQKELYYYLWCAMSEESQHIVQTGWNEYSEVCDAAKLMQRIKFTHEHPYQKRRPMKELAFTMKDFIELKMRPDESFITFSSRVWSLFESYNYQASKIPSIRVPGQENESPSLQACPIDESFWVEIIMMAIPKNRFPRFFSDLREDEIWQMNRCKIPTTVSSLLDLLSRFQE